MVLKNVLLFTNSTIPCFQKSVILAIDLPVPPEIGVFPVIYIVMEYLTAQITVMKKLTAPKLVSFFFHFHTVHVYLVSNNYVLQSNYMLI